MYSYEKKEFRRQMYSNDSEAGRIKLQSIKENLYEATTKVILYSVEMYTQKELNEWVRTGLPDRLDKTNNNVLKNAKEELEQGHISKLDITNACNVINGFVRQDALIKAREDSENKRRNLAKQISELEERERIIEEHRQRLESLLEEEVVATQEEKVDIEEEVFFKEEQDDNSDILDSDYETEFQDFIEGDDEEETEEFVEDDDEVEDRPLTEDERFLISVKEIKTLNELSKISDNVAKEKQEIKQDLENLISLSKDGKDILKKQFNKEIECLENLRDVRNKEFAHKVEDEDMISFVGSWEPEGGPLYLWAQQILDYIKVIEERYKYYAWFDDYYAARERKDKFDSCKVYVQKQIKELYVNHSNIVFEFAGDLYDKQDDDYNFKKLIENMAINWNTGIRYLTVVTNEDLPELNLFFKECLSGTNKYVDSYLVNRNVLREACKKLHTRDVDCIYFRLLYHLNSNMEKIYWKGRSLSQKEFAHKVIHKYIRVTKKEQLDARLEEYDDYLNGIDVKKWCEYHLLSESYFKSLDDAEGERIAKEMEDAIIDYCKNPESGRMKFKRVMRASARLYFYMEQDYVFWYGRSNGHTVNWRTLEDARAYMENGQNFSSYEELYGFIDTLYRSEYFKVWKNHLSIANRESEVDV